MPFSLILVMVDLETNPPEQKKLITTAGQLFYDVYADVYKVNYVLQLFLVCFFSSLSNLSAPVL